MSKCDHRDSISNSTLNPLGFTRFSAASTEPANYTGSYITMRKEIISIISKYIEQVRTK